MLYNIPGNVDVIVSSIKNHRRYSFPNFISYLTLASQSGYIHNFGYITPLMYQTVGDSSDGMFANPQHDL